MLGTPLTSAAARRGRLAKLVALPVLSSDLLSSVAYGPEAMLAVLVLAGAGALRLSLPLAGGLAALMLAVRASFRQIVRAYPSGAGSYQVAGNNLGGFPPWSPPRGSSPTTCSRFRSQWPRVWPR